MTRSTDGPRFGWLSGTATALSILACYGTLLLIGALSSLGIALTVHEGAWAGAITFFATLAVIGVLIGYRRHRSWPPVIVSAAGAALIAWVMYGKYDRLVELLGFAALVLAAVWNWSLKTLEQQEKGRHDRANP